MVKTRGIVFKTLKYGESSLIADIYTEQKGLQKYLVDGVRKKKARFNPSLLQVMSMIDLVAYDRSDRTLNRVKEIRPAYIFQALPFDVRKGAIGLFLMEIARKSIRESEENQRLFDFLYDTLQFLDETEVSISNLHLLFLIELSAFLGFLPSGECGQLTPFFDLQEGLFVSDIPSHKHYLDEEMSLLFHQLIHCRYHNCHEVGLRVNQRRHLLEQLLNFYRLHIERFPTIHSHAILKEVL